MAGYHTGYAFTLGQTVGARHSHLCNAGYQYDQSAKELNDEEIVDYLIKEEKERCMLTSLVICLFARKVYDRETVLRALNSIGIPFTNDDLTKTAEETFFTRLRIKQKLGYSLENERFLRGPLNTYALGKMDEERMNKLLKMYVQRLQSEYENYSSN